MFYIGSLRRLLFVPFSTRWNSFVLDFTAGLENGFFVRSSVKRTRWHHLPAPKLARFEREYKQHSGL